MGHPSVYKPCLGTLGEMVRLCGSGEHLRASTFCKMIPQCELHDLIRTPPESVSPSGYRYWLRTCDGGNMVVIVANNG